jgi:hypothetical protein
MRVKQQLCQALPPSAHIQLSLDHTKLWCGINGGPPPKELAYQPTKLQIFQELDRQLGFQTPIPPDVLSTKSTIITPLTDGEQEEEREPALYIEPFVRNFEEEASPPAKQTPIKRKKEEKMIEGKQAINVNTVFEDVNMLWQETFKLDAALNFGDPQKVQKIVDFTNKLTKRNQQKEKDQAVTENILN